MNKQEQPQIICHYCKKEVVKGAVSDFAWVNSKHDDCIEKKIASINWRPTSGTVIQTENSRIEYF